MREGTNERTNERTYTTTKHITTFLLRSRVKITGEYWINCKEFQVNLEDIVKILTELCTNLCDQTSVLYHLTPQIVGSLVHYFTSLVDYTGQVGEWMGIQWIDKWWEGGPTLPEKIEHGSIHWLAQNHSLITTPSTGLITLLSQMHCLGRALGRCNWAVIANSKCWYIHSVFHSEHAMPVYSKNF